MGVHCPQTKSLHLSPPLKHSCLFCYWGGSLQQSSSSTVPIVSFVKSGSIVNELIMNFISQMLLLLKPHSNGLYWGHQCSWTFTRANSKQVSIMQSFNHNRTWTTGARKGLNLPRPKSLGWIGVQSDANISWSIRFISNGYVSTKNVIKCDRLAAKATTMEM